jgi:hypothetical protein
MTAVEDALQQEFPEATQAECRRFVRACRNNGSPKRPKSDDQVKAEAEKMLEDYLDWRSSLGLDHHAASDHATHGSDRDKRDDGVMWDHAVRRTVDVLASMKAAKDASKKLEDEMKQQLAKKDENGGGKALVNYDIDFSDSHNSDEDKAEAATKVGGDLTDKGSITDSEEIKAEEKLQEAKQIRQIVFRHQKDGTPITDMKGNKILCVLPAMIDKKTVPAETYGIALSFYFDHMFDRDSEEKVTVLLDVRSGRGWPNVLAIYMINYVRQLAKMLQCHLPERLERMVVFPVPRAALGVWAAMKWAFHTDVMDKIVLFPGPAETGSPLPKQYLQDYVEDAILDFVEEQRIGRFEPTEAAATQDMEPGTDD